MNWKQIIWPNHFSLWWLAGTMLYVIVTGSIFMLVLSVGFDRFDALPDFKPGLIDHLANFLEPTLNVLLQPAWLILKSFYPKAIPNPIEWLAVILNSLLWGFAIAHMLRWLTKIFRRRIYKREIVDLV